MPYLLGEATTMKTIPFSNMATAEVDHAIATGDIRGWTTRRIACLLRHLPRWQIEEFQHLLDRGMGPNRALTFVRLIDRWPADRHG
ncbi:MAG: hypothetical protein H0W83_12275 [Planctomycetes bacterium]|nr:hypothetical protein [Planctomycetota bacterium]